MKWIKSNGSEIETNDRKETIEYCKSLGWESVKKEVKKEIKKETKKQTKKTKA